MNRGEESSFAAVLRTLREQAGLTQEELAERAGLSADAIGLLERGERRRPQRYTIDQLAVALALPGEERARFVAAARAAAATSSPPDRAGLPVAATPIIGRDDEIGALLTMIGPPGMRLVTLTGPGGVGKTRLALALAERLAPRFADGAAFVPLAAVEDPALVADALARTLAIPERPGQPLDTVLIMALRGQQRLLVLDNCEHVLAAASLLTGLLAACPRLALLVTSRTPLHVTAEQQFPVAPFAVPDDAHLAAYPDVGSLPALALFADRARAVAPAFAVTEANRSAVLAICRRLDGLPLAIELAAAWVKALPPRALLTRLERRLPLLVGGARDLPARHRTVRDAIAWSDALLPNPERAVFRRLSVFVGGWTLEAAEAICTMDGGEAQETLAALAALVDASLIVPPDEAAIPCEEPRYGMLETVREYAAGELAASGEEATIRDRHTRYYLELVEHAGAHLIGPDEGRWLARLEEEHPNLRAALRRAMERGDMEAMVRLAAVLWRFWAERGHVAEGRRWLEAILALADADGGAAAPRIPPLRRAMLLHVTGNLARTQGEYDAAIRRYEECLAIRRAHNDDDGIAAALHNLGIVAHEQGDDVTAIRRYEEALPLVQRRGNTYGIAFNRTSLADALRVRGDVNWAIERYEEGLAHFRALGHAWGSAHALVGLGNAWRVAGDLERATASYREAATLNLEIGHRQGLADTLEGLAHLARVRGKPQRAVRLFGAAAALRERIGAPLPPIERGEYERAVATVRSEMGAAGFAAAWEHGERMAPAAALALVI